MIDKYINNNTLDMLFLLIIGVIEVHFFVSHPP